MVSSVPSVKPLISLDFETSVFKKEKISLAGHNEVRTFFFSIYCLMLILNVAEILCFLSRLRKIGSFFLCCFFFFWSYMLYYAVMVIDSVVLCLCVVHC